MRRTKDPPIRKPLRSQRKGFVTEEQSSSSVVVPRRNTVTRLRPKAHKVKGPYPQPVVTYALWPTRYGGSAPTNAQQLSLFAESETILKSKNIPKIATSICIGSMTVRHYLALWEFWTDEPTGWEKMPI